MTRRDGKREVRVPVLPTSEEADRVVDALLPDRVPSRRLERRAAARVVPAETRPGDHATERGGAMTADELEAIRERLGRHVHNVTPDHEAALALLAEVDRLRTLVDAMIAQGVADLREDVADCLDVRSKAELRAEVDRLRREALEDDMTVAELAKRDGAEDMRRRAVEVLNAEHEYDAAALVEGLPTSTEAPDGG